MADLGTFVLSRRIPLAPDHLGAALASLPDDALAQLCFVTPFERKVSGAFHPVERVARARLAVGRRGRERVEIEVGPWSARATEIRLRPVARHPQRWSARRARRYFGSAHAATDEVVAALAATAPAVRRPGRERRTA
jgi:hypothetical protein